MSSVVKVPVEDRTDIFLLRNFLSPQECRAFIADSEAHGYEEAAIATAIGQQVVKDVRNNGVLMMSSGI